jgi:hypothetical protein
MAGQGQPIRRHRPTVSRSDWTADGVAYATVRGALWLAFRGAPPEVSSHLRFIDLTPDWRVLTFLLATGAAATLAFGLMPAIQATRSSLVQANRGEFANDYRPARLRNALVVVQVTVCALLLISAAVTLRSERQLAAQGFGFDPREGFSLTVVEKFRAPVAQRLRWEPRVASVGAVSQFVTVASKTPVSVIVGTRGDSSSALRAIQSAADQVARLVLRQTLRLAAAGAALGALAALALARVIAHDIQPIDVFNWSGYAGGVLVVVAAALAASWVPARRAVRIDPAVTLRCD